MPSARLIRPQSEANRIINPPSGEKSASVTWPARRDQGIMATVAMAHAPAVHVQGK